MYGFEACRPSLTLTLSHPSHPIQLLGFIHSSWLRLGCLALVFFSYWTWTPVTPPSFQALPPVLPVHPIPIPIFPSPIPVLSCLVSCACLSLPRKANQPKHKHKSKSKPPPFPSTFHPLYPPHPLPSFFTLAPCIVPTATALRCTIAHGPPSISSSTCHALPLTHPAIFLHLSPQFQLQIPNLCCFTPSFLHYLFYLSSISFTPHIDIERQT